MGRDTTRLAAVGRSIGSSRPRAAGRIAAAVAALFAARAATATTYAWDPNGAAGFGGTSNWNTTNAYWNTGGGTNVPWPMTGTANVALFGGTAGTVTVNSAVSANGLTFTTAGYTIAGSSPLTLNGTSPTFNTSGNNDTFGLGANELFLAGGTSTIVKAGAGVLTLVNDQRSSLNSAVTWDVTGGTLNAATGIYGSRLAISTAQSLGTPTGNVVMLDGGTLAFNANSGPGYATGRTINVTANGGAIYDGGFAPGLGIVNNGGSTIAPTINVVAGAGLNLVATNVLDLDAAAIAGAGSVTVYGNAAGTSQGYGAGFGVAELLSKASTYTGGTTVTAGATLVANGTGSLGAATAPLTVAGTVNLNAANLTVGKFTSASGTVDFNVSSGNTVNTLAATSAAVSGTTRVVLGLASVNASSGTNTYTVATSAAGGLSGSYVASFLLPGGQNLSVPETAVIHTVGGVPYRLTATATANAAGTAVTVTTADAPAPSHTIAVDPLGSSITEGISTSSPYDGGGYRSQLYQNLVNDGRFTPTFVGTSTLNGSNLPNGPDLMTTVGQGNNEGHSGYTTGAILANLAGSYLAPGNGINPDVVPLNVGGNDYVANPTDTTAIGRLGQIIDTVEQLRPNATVIVSSVLYRGDGGGAAGNGIVTLYDPLIPALVYSRVLAGEHVSYVDTASLITPGNSLTLLGPDLIHPTQAGYNLMANAFYQSVTTGQAFYTGAAGVALNAGGSGSTSFDLDYKRTTDAGVLPAANTDVYFNGGGAGGVVPLGANVSVRSVNFTAGATVPVFIQGGTNTLTLGPGGITVQAGTAAHTIAAPVVLGTAQTWSSLSTNRFTVTGSVSGTGPLTVGLGGTGVIVLAGNNTYVGGTTLAGGTLVAANTAGSATGPGPLAVAAAATLTGTGSVAGPVAVSGTITAGLDDGSVGTLSTGPETWLGLGRLLTAFTVDGTGNDQIDVATLTLSATPANPFYVAVTSPGSPTLTATAKFVLVADAEPAATNPFAPIAFAATTRQDLSFSLAGVRPATGYVFQFDTQPDGAGYDLVLGQVAVPEPASLAAVGAAAVLLRRRRR